MACIDGQDLAERMFSPAPILTPCWASDAAPPAPFLFTESRRSFARWLPAREGTVMTTSRRRFLHVVTGAAALPAVSRIAWAQTYPSRRVRVIVPFPAGGVVDLFGRLLAQWLSERFGQPFVVENRAGAGGNIGTEAVVKAAPDGYTLLLIGANNSWNVSLYEKLNFDFIRDIAPVAGIFHGIGALVAHPSFPARSVPELIMLRPIRARSMSGQAESGAGNTSTPSCSK